MRRRKKVVDPKTIKRHSDIVKKQAVSEVIVLGDKEETETGYVIT